MKISALMSVWYLIVMCLTDSLTFKSFPSGQSDRWKRRVTHSVGPGSYNLRRLQWFGRRKSV